jgi:phospholipid/cholesterol/gamma-HCH transport system ATP-binding protein
VIIVTHLSKSFNGQKILEDICLDIKEGEILAVLGQSGAGKSVLLKHIIGLLKPDSGSVSIDGKDIASMSEEDLLALRKGIGYLFQEGALYDFMTVEENVGFPLREHSTLNSRQIKEKVLSTLKSLDLSGVEKKYPSELSGGMKKRVALARAIILDSRILLCDEPTSGLDPIRSRDISDLIQRVSRTLKCTTVLTSHDIDNSFRIADRIAIIEGCRLIACGSRDELQRSSNQFIQEFIR